MPYFDADAPEHLALLPPALRDHEDIANLAATAELLVVQAYTREEDHAGAVAIDVGTAAERFVWLRGYAVDPAGAVPALAAALRQEIAGVIRWQAARGAKKAGLESESAGDPATSKTYRADAEEALPPGFGAFLRPFAIRPVGWAI